MRLDEDPVFGEKDVEAQVKKVVNIHKKVSEKKKPKQKK